MSLTSKIIKKLKNFNNNLNSAGKIKECRKCYPFRYSKIGICDLTKSLQSAPFHSSGEIP